MKRREDLLPYIVSLFDGRPVRWAESPQTLGDYDGRDRTLEVFNADPSEQRNLLRRFRPARSEIEAIAGGSVVVVFHTRSESARLYREFVVGHEIAQLRAIADQLRVLLPAAEIERGEGGAVDLVVRLGGRHVVIAPAVGAGFDISLVTDPAQDQVPDFRITDIERVCRSVQLLISDPEEINLDERLGHVPSEREVANTNMSADDPADLDVEDQVVSKGTKNPPRKAA